jgi:hypothetical protein
MLFQIARKLERPPATQEIMEKLRSINSLPESEGFDRIGQAFCSDRWAIYNIDSSSIG